LDGEEVMKKLFDSNWFTITLSVLVALILWIYVVYEISPTFETTIKNVPINFVRQSEELSNGKLHILSKNAETVNVKIKGKRATLAKVTRDSVYCNVNMADVDVAGTHKIPITVTFDISGVELVSKDPYNAIIVVDKVVTEEMDIAIETKGTPADGFIFDTIEYSTEKIRVTGPQSVVSKIKTAGITVDITGKTDSVSGRYKIILADSKGNEIDDSGISRNISNVEIKCNILQIKEIPVSPTFSSETTAQGKKVSAKNITPQKVTVLGPRSIVDSLTKIPTEEIKVSYVRDGATAKTALQELPEGVRLEEEVEVVEVELKVE
jgi:YbbR domain-containing protein